jgi:hypothetical protein
MNTQALWRLIGEGVAGERLGPQCGDLPEQRREPPPKTYTGWRLAPMEEADDLGWY